MHRDLKPGNILLGRNLEIKLADFGLAAALNFKGERRQSVCGTATYMAPEQVDPEKGHSHEADVWAFGVTLFTLLTGQPPFPIQDMEDIKKLFYKSDTKLTFPPKIDLSDDVKSMLTAILQPQYKSRAKLSDLRECAFFNRNKVPRVLPMSCLTQ